MVKYHYLRSKDKGEINNYTDTKPNIAHQIIENAKSEKREVLTAFEVYSILNSYNIPLSDWAVVKNSDEAIITSNKIGFPVVIKADSDQIIHKSDVGGVVLNVCNNEQVIKVVQEMQQKFKVNNLKFFIQKQQLKALELIVGAKKEQGLGHVIMFGLGGIFVEIFKDVTFNITPVSNTEANEMLDNIKAVKLINGYRGSEGVNKNMLADVLQRVSKLVTENPEIKELDINPIFAYKDKVCAVDARIIL